MSARGILKLSILLVFVTAVTWMVVHHIHKKKRLDRYHAEQATILHPPDILAPIYLKFDYDPQDYKDDSFLVPCVLFDRHKPLIYLKIHNDAITNCYDYQLNLVSSSPTNSYELRPNSDNPYFPPDNILMAGGYYFSYDPKDGEWEYGGDILDMPEGLMQSDSRAIISRTHPPAMKDWSIQFDGKMVNEGAAYYTGDNLLGAAEKHSVPATWFTGNWTLIIQGQPVLRQKAQNLCLTTGVEFDYSPVYGLVLFNYHYSDTKATLYMIKVPASGRQVYQGLTRSVTVD